VNVLLFCPSSGPKDHRGIVANFEKWIEVDAIPRAGDEITFESGLLCCEMEVEGTSWYMKGEYLVPTVQLSPVGGCSDDAFLAAGWTRT
jgi:hypothetical protein